MNGIEAFEQFIAPPDRGERVEGRDQGVAIRHPGLAEGRVGRIGEIRPAQDLDQFAELPIVARRDDDVSIHHREDVVGHDVGMAIAEPAPLLPRDQEIERLVTQHRHLGVEQSTVDPGPRPGRGTADQGCLDAVGGHRAP